MTDSADSENNLENRNEAFKQLFTVGSISFTVLFILYFIIFSPKNKSQTYLKTITVLKISYTIVKIIINDKLNEYFPTLFNRKTPKEKKTETTENNVESLKYKSIYLGNEVKIRKKPRMMSSLPLSSLSDTSLFQVQTNETNQINQSKNEDQTKTNVIQKVSELTPCSPLSTS